MDEHTAYINTLNLVGGRLCLDFANTVSRHSAELSNERLTIYEDLLVWSRLAGVVDEQKQGRLAATAATQPALAASTFEQAFTLRETIFRIFSTVAAGQPAAQADLDAFNAMLRTGM